MRQSMTGARSVIRAQNSLWLVKAQATVAKQPV